VLSRLTARLEQCVGDACARYTIVPGPATTPE
jgi:hypothetical protein